MKTKRKIKRITQQERIFNYLVSYKSITNIEAYRRFGTFGLHRIICTLRKKGFKIETKKKKGFNRFGDRVHFAVYVYKGA